MGMQGVTYAAFIQTQSHLCCHIRETRQGAVQFEKTQPSVSSILLDEREQPLQEVRHDLGRVSSDRGWTETLQAALMKRMQPATVSSLEKITRAVCGTLISEASNTMIWHRVLIIDREFDGKVPRSSVALRSPNRAYRLH
jgi:hypothetical protein